LLTLRLLVRSFDGGLRSYFVLYATKEIRYYAQADIDVDSTDEVKDAKGEWYKGDGTCPYPCACSPHLCVSTLWHYHTSLTRAHAYGSPIFNAGDPLGNIDLSTVFKVDVSPATEDCKFGFFFETRDRVWEFRADTEESQKQWLKSAKALMMPRNPLLVRKEGFLLKEGGNRKSWKKR
jgi:hypothetical protein